MSAPSADLPPQAPPDGEVTLDQLLVGRGDPLPTARVLAVVHQLAAELDQLHAQEVVHGGLTPACIVLRGDRAVMLTDGQDRPGVRRAFEAPEHRRPGRELSGHADQYALALIAYELFLGRSRVSLDAKTGLPVIEEADLSPARLLRPDGGPAVNAVLRAAMSSDPGARYPTTTAFAEALAEALRDPHAHALLPHAVAGGPSAAAQRAADEVGDRRLLDRKPYDPAFGSRLVTIVGLSLAVATLLGAAWFGYYGSAPRFLTTLGARSTAGEDGRAALRLVLPGGDDGASSDQAAVAGRNFGYVRVTTGGNSPAVILDGRPVGRGAMLLAVEPGVHLIEVRENGRSYLPSSRPIRVGSRDTTDARFVAQ
jgi:hypothetical protein